MSTGARVGVGAVANWIRRGGVAVFPTDTVTGLGGLARSRRAVAAVFSLKRRPARKPLTLLLHRRADVEGITGPLASPVRRVLAACWPGALTAVLPLAVKLPRGVGRRGTVGVRVPAHQGLRRLMRLVGAPMATSSANVSGESPPRSAAEAASRLGPSIRALPGLSNSTPSTVADLTRWPPRLIRVGAISRKTFARAVARAQWRGKG